MKMSEQKSSDIRSESNWFPLKLNWTVSRASNSLIFDYQNQQLDNIALMMTELCQESLLESRVLILVTELFEMYNRIYCSSEATTKSVTPDDLKKSEMLVQEIDQNENDLNSKALEICAKAIEISTEGIWKYLNATILGLKAESYFIVKEPVEGNKHRMEMLKLIHAYELFETLDLVGMILDHCSQLLTLLWNENNFEQIDYLLFVSKYFLDNVKINDDFDGLKYQKLRQYWHLIVGVNEGRFIEISWKNLKENCKVTESSHMDCVKFTIDLPEPPKALTHTPLNNPEEFLGRLMVLENHQILMFLWSPLDVNSEHDSYTILAAIIAYAKFAYKTITQNN